MKQREPEQRVKKPAWLKRRLPSGHEYEEVREILNTGRLHSVCEEAMCPNIWECFSRRTATFLILGSRCTRSCGFCAIAHGPEGAPDPGEPVRVAEAAQKMQLRYVVITSVTRDDLSDGGAGIFSATIEAVRKRVPDALVEVLIPDFMGNAHALQRVLGAKPHILNHNIETVSRLYPRVRPEARYERSMGLLRLAGAMDKAIPTKSGLMLGLGESSAEILETLEDLLEAGCRIVTLGQYLQPTKGHLAVKRFIPPEEFNEWRVTALKMGFSEVASGPFVRSSYHARELYRAVKAGKASAQNRA